MDAVLALIHTDYIFAGVAGGFMHALHERKLEPHEVVRFILAGGLVSNFVVGGVLYFFPNIPVEGAGTLGFFLGYGAFRVCRFADRYMDKELKPYEGPEHD